MKGRSGDGVHETETGVAYVDEHEIVRFVCTPGASLDEAAAIANTDAIRAAADGGRYPLIVDMREIKSIDARARRYHATVSGRYFTAVALLVGSPLSRVIGNFFLGLNRPDYPLALFDDEQAALSWLRLSLQ